MIPKVIHYCWFGRGEKNDDVKRYISSWKAVMPDYQVIEWNEENFDVNRCRFSKEAYENKAYAFVSDYARMVILLEYGGIYLDVDVEAIKPFDECLNHRCFLGFEGENGGIATCTIGAEAGCKVIEIFKNYYESVPYIREDGKINNRPNTLIIEELIRRELHIEFNWKEGINEGIYFYDWHVFHPLSLVTGKLYVNNRTLSIHHHTLLWVPLKTKIIKFIRMKIFVPIFGEGLYQKIERRRKR